jgi:O-antigen/teichoic acid export membrane protein
VASFGSSASNHRRYHQPIQEGRAPLLSSGAGRSTNQVEPFCHNAQDRGTVLPNGILVRNVSRNRASLGAVAGGLGAQAMLVISGPATARLLGVTERGRLALLVVVVSIISQVAALGLPTAVAYTASSSRVPSAQLLRLLAQTWVQLCLIAAAAAGTAVFLVSRSDPSSPDWLEALLGVVYVVSAMTISLMFACLQGEQRYTPMNWLRVMVASLSALVLFILLAIIHHTSVSVVFGTLALANVVAAAAGAYFVLAAGDRSVVETAVGVRSLLRFGLAALPADNAPLETLSLDQLAVGTILPARQLGLYAVAAAFDNLSSILVAAFGSVALTRITGEPDVAERRRLIRRIGVNAAAIALGSALFAEAIVGWLLPLAFGSAFAPAIPVARVLIVAGSLLAFRRILVVFLQAAGRPGRTAAGEAVALVTLSIAAVVFVPLFGLFGAGYALILAALVADLYLVRVLGWL